MFCRHILKSCRYFLEGFLGLQVRRHIYGDCRGYNTRLRTSLQQQEQWVQLHCVLQKHLTVLWGQAVASLGPWECVAKEATQSGVLYHCLVGTCTCAAVSGAAIGALTLPCELISSSSTIFTVGCPLICHYVPKVLYHNSICFTASHHHCVQCYAQLAGRLSTTTSSCRASVHWFLTPLRAVRILTF